MPRLTYADIWETQEPWPDGLDVLGSVVRYQRGRAPRLVYTPTPAGILGSLGMELPTFVHPVLGLVSTQAVVPGHLLPVLQARCTLVMNQWHCFDVDAVMNWGKEQRVSDYTRLVFDARLAEVESNRLLCGETPYWAYVAVAFGLDPLSLPPLATARTARVWSAQVSAE